MSKYFKEIEQGMNVGFLTMLDSARELAGIPFVINSAFRTEEHNKKVGGKPNSSHLKGLAVDIKATNSRTRFLVLNALIAAGFNRIGIADTFIHVDFDLTKDKDVIWTY
jgi:zinc D-Ala-D-Ala carboxypeptidase